MVTLRSWKKRPRDAAMHAMPCSMHAHVGRGQIGLLRHTASPITVTAAAQKSAQCAAFRGKIGRTLHQQVLGLRKYRATERRPLLTELVCFLPVAHTFPL